MGTTNRIDPENGRYGADLVFVHGLWGSGAMWRPVAVGFAHRGWCCHVVELTPDLADFDACVAHVRSEIQGLESPPILIGHDAGALVALRLAAEGGLAGTVAVAPLLGGVAPLVPRWARMWQGLLGQPVAPPEASAPFRQDGSEVVQARLADCLVPEPPRRVSSLRGAVLEPEAPVGPALMVAHADDPVVSAPLVEVTANGIGADFEKLGGGHWPMLEPRIDPWTAAVHRWIIRRAPELVLLDGEEDLRDE